MMQATKSLWDCLVNEFAFRGDVDSSLAARQRYATDASVYEQLPMCVVFPKDGADLQALVAFANHYQRAITMRGAGTSLAGQAIGNDIVADVSRYMTRILAIDTIAKTVRVEVGVVLDDLNRALRAYGLWLAIDTSTSNRCVMGGVVANNSCGAYSLAYQTPRTQIMAANAILSDAQCVHFSAIDPSTYAQKQQQNNREGEIYRCLDRLIRDHQDAINDAFPDPSLIRRNTGYALDALAQQAYWTSAIAGQANLAPLLCGSEGTLALITDVTMQLQPLPTHRALLVVHFDDVFAALDATEHLLTTRPVAIELIDAPTLVGTKGHPGFERYRFWIAGEPEAVQVIEYFAETPEILDQHLREGQALAQQLTGVYACVAVVGEEMAAVWEVRKAGLGLLMGKVGDKKAVAVIEDASVPVASLSAFMRDIRALMQALSVNCIYYGHASVGLIHLRPELDLSYERDKALFVTIAERVAERVKHYRGALSGEHGDGRLRAPFLQQQFGSQVYALLVAVKQAFDPEQRFNPHKVIGQLPIDTDWRIPVGKTVITTGFNWSHEGGFAKSVEKCNGAGACRKSTGAMCPSFQATHDDAYSTRGRANLLRFALQSPNPADTMTQEGLQTALALCLSCKACKSECPATVDMSRLKSEVLFQVNQRKPRSLQQRLIKIYPRLLPWINRFRVVMPLANQVRGLLSPFGWDSRRQLPIADGRDLKRWWLEQGIKDNPIKGERVCVWLDVYSRYLHTQAGKATITVLQHLGFQVEPVWLTHSPRLLISQGYLTEARTVLMQAIAQLPKATQAWAIVGIEPSELLVLRDDGLALIDDMSKAALAAWSTRIYVFEEAMLAFAQKYPTYPWPHYTQPLMVHVHCHQKSLTGINSQKAFQLLGAHVSIAEAGCCGMAGSFGYEHVDLSERIAQQGLLAALKRMPEQALFVSAGTSCQQQLRDFTSLKGLHPAIVFSQALELKQD